jgi:hypothetical protein
MQKLRVNGREYGNMEGIFPSPDGVRLSLFPSSRYPRGLIQFTANRGCQVAQLGVSHRVRTPRKSHRRSGRR